MGSEPIRCNRKGLGGFAPTSPPHLNSSGGPMYARVAAAYTLKKAVDTPYLATISGTQYGQ
ncbi:hypothetical protein HanIR_Chr16g0801201 [Helianthus annuus]|nr:hypothetical protein HanIR_Chr16g0801201 [Helianthus annuus]